MKRKIIQIIAGILIVSCFIYMGSIVVTNWEFANTKSQFILPNMPMIAIIIYAVVLILYIALSIIKRYRVNKFERTPSGILLPILIIIFVFGLLIVNSEKSKQPITRAFADIKDGEYIEREGLPPINIVGEIPEDKIEYMIMECIEKQPKILLDQTQLIHLCTHEEFEELKQRMGIEEAIAFATSIDRNIYLDASIRGLQRVVTHELAHNYDFNNGYISGQSWFKKRYEKLISEESFSLLYDVIDVRYARSDVSEFFAEVSDAYFNRRQKLKSASKELYALFKEVYAKE